MPLLLYYYSLKQSRNSTLLTIKKGLLAIAISKQPPQMEQVVFEQQDAQELTEIEADEFDVVISRNVLWTITDHAKALSERNISF